jgi:cell wall-associated NlpC family hydrolase
MLSSAYIINSYVGTHWKKGGRTKEEGLDCWGFFIVFYKDVLGIAIKDDYIDIQPGQTRKITKAFAKGLQSHETKWEKIDFAIDYCGVALSQNKKTHHVGVYVKGGVLHATERHGVVYHSMQRLKMLGYTTINFYKYKVN